MKRNRQEYFKCWWAENRGRMRAYRQRPEVKTKHRLRQRGYVLAHREEINARARTIERRQTRNSRMRKYRACPEVRLVESLRRRLNGALRGIDKSKRTLALLGCSVEHLKVWLTFYFQPGMTWENYGRIWEVDHVRPCASFDLNSPVQQQECFHYANLQPLFASDNSRKSDSYVML